MCLQDKARQLGDHVGRHRFHAERHRRRHHDHADPRQHLPDQRQRPRAQASERGSIETLQNLQLSGANGQPVPLAAVATFRYELEQPVVWRRSRIPTITVKAGIAGRHAAGDRRHGSSSRRWSNSEPRLPAGLPRRDRRRRSRRAARRQGPIVAVVPLMLFVMATILMIQLQSFQRLFLVVAVAPLGLIGVVAALLPSGAPMGFVAILGRAGADRHPDPQLGDPHRADRAPAGRRRGPVERSGRGHRAPHAPDPADGGRRQPGAHPDRSRSVLGSDGLSR